MDVLLISGRAVARVPHPSVARAAAHASELVAAGHRVRWLCLLTPDEAAPPAAPSGVERIEHRAAVPNFRGVLDRLFELGSEKVLVRALRDRPADVAHVLACGGATSVHLGWLAERLGAPHVVEVDLAEALCHRGTLIDETGAPCVAFDDPARCTACCLTPFDGGSGPVAAWFGRRLRWAGDASPWPNLTAFENRLDSIVGSLLSAAAIAVRSEADRAALIRVGVPPRAIRVMPAPSVGDWLGLYAAVRA